jgi:hypothetical protein
MSDAAAKVKPEEMMVMTPQSQVQFKPNPLEQVFPVFCFLATLGSILPIDSGLLHCLLGCFSVSASQYQHLLLVIQNSV